MSTTNSPVICFGQQPCGFYPKKFLFAKIQTARRLQQEIGGTIVFFYHDSDQDPRETRTILRHRQTNETALLNFTFENKLQRKHSPLYLKRVPAGWQEKTALQLPNYLDRDAIDLFKKQSAPNVADFCLEMYRSMGLLEGITVMRSSDPDFRKAACDITDFYVDIPHEGEIVRARWAENNFKLHEGGDVYMNLPLTPFNKDQISPARDSRLAWMQSVVNCTHYVAGESEQAYLRKTDASSIEYVSRDKIDRADEAYTELPTA